MVIAVLILTPFVVACMALTGAMTYRYGRFVGWGTGPGSEWNGYAHVACKRDERDAHSVPMGAAIALSFLWPVALPVVLMMWMAVWSQRAERKEALRLQNIRDMEKALGM